MEVPSDVVLEILSRVPVDKAAKIQSLSKFHAKASYCSYYKDLVAQNQLQPFLDGFLLQSYGSKKYLSFVSPQLNSFPPLDVSLSFLPGCDVKIQAVAPNGLLLCHSRHPIRCKQHFYTVCKLSTKQWKGLPIPRTRYFTENIAMYVLCSNPLHFKILRLSQDQIPSRRPLPYSYTICELFDSKTWRWKLLDDMKSCSGSVVSHSPAVFASGSAHWKMGDGVSIYAFDFYSETWSKIDMPDMRNNDKATTWNTQLVEYEGKLGIMQEFNKPEYSTEIWVMENYSHKSWAKKFDFLGHMPMTLYGSEVSMMWLDYSKVGFSNLETGKCHYKKLEESYYEGLLVFPFFSDFQPWKFDPPMRAIKPKTMIKIVRKRLIAIQNNVHVLISFYFYFVHYNHYLCSILFEIINYALQNS